MMSYSSIITDLNAQTGKYPGIIGVDYEHDRIFTPAQLTACNAILIDYWKKGGIVTINWAPHNPWLNDESDIAGNYGTCTDTRKSGTNLDKVNLSDLVNPSSAIYPIWRKKLDRIASALAELQSAGVAVLWRPLQEMNGDWFWWGTATSPNSGTPYKNIYIDMFRYFTEVKGLHNLLWVFSPCQYAGTDSSGILSCEKFYPGNEYVDIVAGTLYNNALAIGDYNTYCSFGKPVGMAELGAASWDTIAKTGQFDNRKYESVIRKNYPAIAYWVSWHNWDNGDGTFSWMSLNKNKYPKECMESGGVITRDELPSFKE
jgi:mannan endo-1,4-beta-mannosidase